MEGLLERFVERTSSDPGKIRGTLRDPLGIAQRLVEHLFRMREMPAPRTSQKLGQREVKGPMDTPKAFLHRKLELANAGPTRARRLATKWSNRLPFAKASLSGTSLQLYSLTHEYSPLSESPKQSHHTL